MDIAPNCATTYCSLEPTNRSRRIMRLAALPPLRVPLASHSPRVQRMPVGPTAYRTPQCVAVWCTTPTRRGAAFPVRTSHPSRRQARLELARQADTAAAKLATLIAEHCADTPVEGTAPHASQRILIGTGVRGSREFYRGPIRSGMGGNAAAGYRPPTRCPCGDPEDIARC